jgi:DNA invertase Pin-like site-specific DNA recombinase
MTRQPKTPPRLAKTPVGVGYIRVSALAGRDEEQVLSPDTALDASARFFDKKSVELGFPIEFRPDISMLYKDIDKGAYKSNSLLKRKGLLSLLEMAKRGEIQFINFFTVSRLARNIYHAFTIVEQFREAGCQCFFSDDPTVPDVNDKNFEIALFLTTWAARQQSESISKFVSGAIAAKQRRGVHHGTLVVWLEWERVGEPVFDKRGRNITPKRVILSPSWAPIVRVIVDLSLAGCSCSDIAKQLNERGYRRPNQEKWSHHSVYDLLKPVYIEKMMGYDHRSKDKDPVRLQRIFPPLITDEEGERLMLMYHRRGESVPENLRKALRAMGPRGTLLCTGIVRCLVCQRPFKGGGSQIRKYNPERGPIGRYLCQCGKAVTRHQMDDAMRRVLEQVLEDHKNEVRDDSADKEVALPTQQVTVDDINARMRKIADSMAKGLMPPDIFETVMAGYMDERKQLESAQAEVTMPKLASLMDATDSTQAWRTLALEMVAEATYPHTVTLKDRTRSWRDYKAIKVTTKSGRSYFAALYRPHYTGPRVLVEDKPPEVEGQTL